MLKYDFMANYQLWYNKSQTCKQRISMPASWLLACCAGIRPKATGKGQATDRGRQERSKAQRCEGFSTAAANNLVCHVTVLKYNCNEKLWMPYEHRAAEMSRRVVTLNQLVTAIPVAELAKFITCKSPNGRKQYTLSDTGVRFVISQANLAHHFTP